MLGEAELLPRRGALEMTDAIEAALGTVVPARRRSRVASAIALLERRGASDTQHSGRTFLDHLIGTWRLLHLWKAPESVCLAGLMHSAYGTMFFRTALFSDADREEIRTLVGTEAERLAFLFCIVDRRHLALIAKEGGGRKLDEPRRVKTVRDGALSLTPADVAALSLIELANAVEQCGQWAGPIKDWLAVVAACDVEQVLPPMVFCRDSRTLDSDNERYALLEYQAALAATTAESALPLAQRAALMRPWAPEPHLLCARMALRLGEYAVAHDHAEAALMRVVAWGTGSDKRLSWGGLLRGALDLSKRTAHALGHRTTPMLAREDAPHH